MRPLKRSTSSDAQHKCHNSAKYDYHLRIISKRHHGAGDDGQVLLVTDGRGWYQEWGREAQALKPGDCATIPANVKHWHGAAKDSWMSHVAFEACGTGMSNEWCEPVSDEEYLKL